MMEWKIGIFYENKDKEALIYGVFINIRASTPSACCGVNTNRAYLKTVNKFYDLEGKQRLVFEEGKQYLKKISSSAYCETKQLKMLIRQK